MRAPTHATPAEPGRFDAHDRFKRRSRNWTWIGISVATLIHFLLLAFVALPQRAEMPEMQQPAAAPMRAIRLLPRIEVPPPPERIAPIAPPVLQPMPPIEDFRVERVALQDELIESFPIPAPPTTIVSDDEAGFEHFVPSMVKPELVNRDEVRRKLEREYPRYLQNAGIGGALMILFWIDEAGEVHKYEIKRSSGRKALDEAAERVVPIMRFRPAYKLGRPVKIIVALPVRFESH